MNVCKDVCRNEKQMGTRKPYQNGYRRCTVCQKAFKTEDVYCFCCGARMRTGAQGSIQRKVRTELVYRIE